MATASAIHDRARRSRSRVTSIRHQVCANSADADTNPRISTVADVDHAVDTAPQPPMMTSARKSTGCRHRAMG